MKSNRFVSIRAAIASVLNDCDPMLVPEGRLITELNLQLQPPATQSEFDHVLGQMDLARHVIRHPVENEGIKTKLTDLGRAELVK